LSSGSENEMREIAGLARKGRLDEAAVRVAQATANFPNDPVLFALGGAVEFHRARYDRAATYLETAYNYQPNDLTIRANLAESLFHTGDVARALLLCDDAAALADSTLRLARLGGHLAQSAEEFDRAIRLYRHVVSKDPRDWSSWNNLGNALTSADDPAGAAEALARALALAPDSQPIRVNLGNALIDAGRFDEAEAVLREAAKTDPADATPFLSLFTMLKALGREDEAYDAIAQAAQRAQGDAHIQSDHGQEAARRNIYDVAERAFEAALSLEANLGPSYVGLASVYERMNREVELDPLRNRAVANAVDAESISYIDALRHKRANDIDAAFEALERAGDVVVEGRKLHLRGIMLDRLGRYDEAFEAFEAMNEHWKEDPSGPQERASQYRDHVAQCTALMSREWLAGWTAPVATQDRASPIFIVGFPRSGTTLLDTMLMADPRVVVLEEEPFIGMAELEAGGMDALPGMTDEQIVAARSLYFERVAGVTDLKADSIIVDKHPMHLNKVAPIRRLFPDARFILALRHPCDVLLSCFLTNFRVNNAMANFLDLKDAAALYDLTFSQWSKACAVFDLPVETVMYERLVEDQARELVPVFDWLGLDWPGDTFDHRDAARARGTVATASYSQVTEPIYTRAKGRWERYRPQLSPIFPVLQPWAAKFGYEI
jgi:Flp pilus assembly protein TadD